MRKETIGASWMDARAAFARDGYVVLRSWLPPCAVTALAKDFESSRSAHLPTDAELEARDLNVDFIGLATRDRLEAVSPARTEAWAYRTLRRAATRRRDGVASERAVLGQLAAAAVRCCGWERVFLFSEVFVAKPPGSLTAFEWHRDDSRQLAKIGGEASPCAYASTWAPLDECTAASGTVILRSKASLAESAVSCSPGDVVVFDKATWHASGPNSSRSPPGPRTNGGFYCHLPTLESLSHHIVSRKTHRPELRGDLEERCSPVPQSQRK